MMHHTLNSIGDVISNTRTDANSDSEARMALWNAICEAIEQLPTHCKVYSSKYPNQSDLILKGQSIPKVQMWQLMELLSLLTILIRADEVLSREILNVFGKTGPIAFSEDSQRSYLWVQYSLKGEQSALGGRPDLMVTSTSETPSVANILRVIEAKCCKHFETQDVRAEFGKAYDLRVTSYFIWTFFTIPERVINGANKLGIDIFNIGFDTPRRNEYINQPNILMSYVADTLERARKASHFALATSKASKDTQQKLLRIK